MGALILGLLGASSARAGIVLDQTNATFDGTSGYAVSPGQTLAQGITVGVSGTLVEVDMGLYRTTGATGTVTLSIVNFVNGTPDTNLGDALATETIDASQIPSKPLNDSTQLGVVAFNALSATIAVTKGEQLGLVITGTGAGAPPWIILTDGMYNYAGGLEYSRRGSATAWSPDSSPNYGNSALTFNTYVNAAATAVPEPSSLTLVGIAGAIGLGVTRARRRSAA